jgi:ABC-type spermidine/putrescine transport system permease subunit I
MAPGILLLIGFALFPLVALVWTGFTKDGSGFTFANFSSVFSSATYLNLLCRTLLIAFVVTVLSIVLGWPAAWALARYVKPGRRALILGLVIVPYITSQLLLIYGFATLIQAGGPISTVLSSLGLTDSHASVLYTQTASIMMLVYESLPTALLVMFSASEQVAESVLEAARTLGAGRFHTFRTVIWPLSATMVFVNFTLTFVQTVGAFAEPAILGGPKGQMLGNAISEQLSSGVNRGFAVAVALALLVASLAVVSAVGGLIALARRPQRGWDRTPPTDAITPGFESITRPHRDLAVAEGR